MSPTETLKLRAPIAGSRERRTIQYRPHPPIQAVQSGTVRPTRRKYADRVKRIEPVLTAEQRARIEQMIEAYGEAKNRRLLQRATNLMRKTEVHQRLVKFEAPPDRVH